MLDKERSPGVKVNLLSFPQSRPPPRYGCVAERAPAPLYVELVNLISQSLDQDLMAVVAIGVASLMPGYVPEIYVMNALLEGNIPQEFKGFHGSGRQPVQFIKGHKARKVQGIVGPQLF